jgi:hypothetical protein
MTPEIVVLALVIVNFILAIILYKELKQYLKGRQKLKALKLEGQRLRNEIRRLDSYRQA